MPSRDALAKACSSLRCLLAAALSAGHSHSITSLAKNAAMQLCHRASRVVDFVFLHRVNIWERQASRDFATSIMTHADHNAARNT